MAKLINKDTKLAEEQSKFKVHCKYCGHTMTFYAFEPDKKICNWCRHLNYRSNRFEFIDKFRKEERKLKYEQNQTSII